MYANAYELKMPTNYVDMNANEMEYDGTGWLSRLISGIGTVCGFLDSSNPVTSRLAYLDPVNVVARMIYIASGGYNNGYEYH